MQLSQTDIQTQHILYSTPPKIQDCYRHRKANIIFKNLEKSIMEEALILNYCQCCGKIVGKEPQLKFKYDPIEAAYLGPGIPLYFAFFRSILYMMLIYLIFGFYTASANFYGTNCVKACGHGNWENKISIFNIFNDYYSLKTQMYFQLIVILATILMNIKIRSYMNYLQIYIDEIFAKPSDYSMIIRNIPETATKCDIQDMIQRAKQQLSDQQRQNTLEFKIYDILMVKDLTQFLQVENRNLKLIKKHIAKKQVNRSLSGQIYFQNPVIPHKFSKTAIVIFSSDESKNYFLNTSNKIHKFINVLWGSYYPRSNVHQIKDQYVSICRAPQPDDLIWENCGKSSRQLLLRRIGLYILSLIVLGIGGGIQYSLQLIRNRYVKPESTYIQYGFSFGAALTVTIFNFLIGQILQFMAFHEGHDTKTQLKVALTFRIVLFQFLNSGVFIILTSIFVNITTDDKTYDFRKSVLTFNILQMMTVNVVNENFMTFFFNKYQIFKQYNRRRILKQTKLFPQIQANKIFEAPTIFLHSKYSFVFKTFWVTVFFMPIMPSVILISSVGLFINYWLQKYLFSGVYSAPQAISSYLSNHVLNLLDYTPLWFTLGTAFMFFVRSQSEGNPIQSQIKTFLYVFMLLSIINIFLPYRSILKRFSSYVQPDPNKVTYEEAMCTFQLTYQDTNPIYLNHHKKRVREEEIFKQQLTKQTEFQQMKMKLTQSQVILTRKDSLLNKSSLISSDFQVFRNRASSVNF